MTHGGRIWKETGEWNKYMEDGGLSLKTKTGGNGRQETHTHTPVENHLLLALQHLTLGAGDIIKRKVKKGQLTRENV